jgi:forespore regulator of the sigma-K checkpoint
MLAGLLVIMISLGVVWVVFNEHTDEIAATPVFSQIAMKEWIKEVPSEMKPNTVYYFALNSDGYLTLYEGDPDEWQVVRTFFQLDVNHLEGSLPQEVVKELHEGIRISDDAEYNSVLSTFSDYVLEEDGQSREPNLK